MPNSKDEKRPVEKIRKARPSRKTHERISRNAAGEKTLDNRDGMKKEKYEILIKNIPCAVYSAFPGKTGPTIFISDKWKDWTGYSPDELYRDPEAWPKCIHPDDREQIVDAFIRACRDKIPYDLEYRIIHKETGQVRYVRDQGLLNKDEKGDMMQVDGIVTDINEPKSKLEKYRTNLEVLIKEHSTELIKTHEVMELQALERNKVEQALREIEREQSTVLQNLSDLIVYRNKDMETVWASKSMADWHGITQEQIVGRVCYKARFGRNKPCEDCHIVEAMKSGKRQELEKKLPDGKFWHVIVNPAFDDSRKIIGTIEISQDITERKRAEHALRQSEEKYRKLFEEGQDGIFLADAETGIIVDCNLAAAEMIEREKSELIGQHQRTLHPADTIHGGFSASFRKHLHEYEGQVLEEQVITRTGRIKQVAIKANLLKVGDRKLLQAVFHDITDRKKAREELEKSKDILEKTFSSLDSAVFILDARKPPQIIDCNPAATEIFGYEKQEMVGNTTEFLHIGRETLSEFQEKLFRSIEKKGILSFFEFKMKKKDGTIFPSEHSVRSLKDDKGRTIGWISVVRDITERKQSEEALRETTGLLETIFEHTHILVACLDRQFNFVRVNRAYAEADDRRPSFFPGKNHFDLYPNAENEQIFRKVVETGESYFAYAKPFVYAEHPERGISYWDWSLVPIKQEQGIVTGLVLTLADVTARKRAEESLQASEGKLNAMLQSISDHMSMMDKDLNIIWANEVAKRQFGEDIIGKKCYEVYHGRRKSCQPQPCLTLRVFEDGQVHEHDTEVINKDGNTIYFHCVANVALRDNKGNPTAVLEISTDITDRKRAEAAVREERDRAQKYLDVAGVMLLVIDANQKVKLINQKGCEILGYDECEIIGNNWIENFVPERVRNEVSFAADKLATGDKEAFDNFENPVLTRSGEERIIAWHNTVLRDKDGKAVATLCSGADITERKMTEEALKESEKTLRSIFRAAPIGIGLVSNRVLLQVNDKICEMFGYSRNELVGKDSRMLYLSDEDYEHVGKIKYEQIRDCGTGTVETRCKCKDGRLIDIVLSSTALDPSDFSKGVTFTALDITERKRAEEALRESEEKFRSLAEQSPNMIFINKKGKVVYTNKKCEEVMGYTREELCSPDFDFRTLVASESLDLINDSFTRHLKGEEVPPYDYTIISKDGMRIEVINASKLIQYEGEAAVLGIVTDITERKRAEQVLRESEERLKILFESAPDTIYLIDSEGRFMDANRAAFELIGFARDEVIGKSLAELDLLSAGQLSKAEANLKKVVAGKLSGPNEYILKRKDGTYVSIEVRTFPVKIGCKILTLGIARDITKHKQTEKELLEHQAKLKSLASQLSLTEERERHRLATDLHDQISQSLVISKIKLDQLCKSSSSDAFKGALEDIRNCLGHTIDDTRALTFDLSYPILYELGFVAAVAEWLTDQIQEKHGIKTDFEDDGHQKPLNDDIRVLLFRNVRELLINVVKHAQANKVKVSIRKVKDHIRVSVEDDGVGFDPVEVTSMAAKRAEFGLFSIRERLEQLGGLIEIDSKIGRGSKITMTAPLKCEDVADGT